MCARSRHRQYSTSPKDSSRAYEEHRVVGGLMRNATRTRTSNGFGVRPSAACPHALHVVTVIPAAYRRRRQLFPSGLAAGCLRSSVPVSLPRLLTHADLPRLLHSTLGAASLVCSGGVCGGPEELCYRCGVLFSGGGVQGVGDAVQLREGVRDGGIGAGCGEQVPVGGS